MKKNLRILWYCAALLYSHEAKAISPPVLSSPQTFAPVCSLITDKPPQQAVWVAGRILSQEDSDLYTLADTTGSVRIFLCIDELTQYTLTPGDRIAVWGVIDKNALHKEKNELYVEKVYLLPEKISDNLNNTH